jgi:transcriptional regulator with XRE-family HTH domain
VVHAVSRRAKGNATRIQSRTVTRSDSCLLARLAKPSGVGVGNPGARRRRWCVVQSCSRAPVLHKHCPTPEPIRRQAALLGESAIAYLLSRLYTPWMTAATILRLARQHAGLTQRQLAHRAGVPQATVGRVEAGLVTPRVDTLEQMLRATGRELTASTRPGVGVDRSQMRQLLHLTPRRRLELAARDAAGIGRLKPSGGRQ